VLRVYAFWGYFSRSSALVGIAGSRSRKTLGHIGIAGSRSRKTLGHIGIAGSRSRKTLGQCSADPTWAPRTHGRRRMHSPLYII